jgi:transketolase
MGFLFILKTALLLFQKMNFDKPHNSMRGQFAYELYERMAKDDKIWLVVGDLGFGMFDRIRDDFPDRAISVGAAEQAGVGICVGLALQGKIPFFYSITNFSLYRPFEFIRNYMNYEHVPVKILGAGRDKDYKDDGITHQSEDARVILDTMPEIVQMWPQENDEIKMTLDDAINNQRPTFISLRR